MRNWATFSTQRTFQLSLLSTGSSMSWDKSQKDRGLQTLSQQLNSKPKLVSKQPNFPPILRDSYHRSAKICIRVWWSMLSRSKVPYSMFRGATMELTFQNKQCFRANMFKKLSATETQTIKHYSSQKTTSNSKLDKKSAISPPTRNSSSSGTPLESSTSISSKFKQQLEWSFKTSPSMWTPTRSFPSSGVSEPDQTPIWSTSSFSNQREASASFSGT